MTPLVALHLEGKEKGEREKRAARSVADILTQDFKTIRGPLVPSRKPTVSSMCVIMGDGNAMQWACSPADRSQQSDSELDSEMRM